MKICSIAPIVLAIGLLLAYEPLLWPHAILLQSVPAMNAIVRSSDITVRLTFNSRVDGPRSKINLALPDGSVRALSLGEQPSLAVLYAYASGLKPGPYKVRWQVLAIDGHISRGEYPFSVQ
jgi:methionine-rich copper-binding protein CopC